MKDIKFKIYVQKKMCRRKSYKRHYNKEKCNSKDKKLQKNNKKT